MRSILKSLCRRFVFGAAMIFASNASLVHAQTWSAFKDQDGNSVAALAYEINGFESIRQLYFSCSKKDLYLFMNLGDGLSLARDKITINFVISVQGKKMEASVIPMERAGGDSYATGLASPSSWTFIDRLVAGQFKYLQVFGYSNLVIPADAQKFVLPALSNCYTPPGSRRQ